MRVVLDRTPFYAESGGQVGDTGDLVGDGFAFRVSDTQKDGDLVIHEGHLLSGEMRAGARVTARVDTHRRQAIRRAHSATHLLHYALHKNLGQHAQQQGSKVDGDWLRFDFTHLSPVEDGELEQIEHDVQDRIADAQPVTCGYLPLAEAREKGAMMLFGEKYPDPVRLVTMGQFSLELCGGTHVENTKDVSAFEIVSEESVSAGIRRMVAYTGEKAAAHAQQVEDHLQATAAVLGVELAAVPDAVKALVSRLRELRKQLTSGSTSGAGGEHDSTGLGALNTYAARRAALRETARTLNVAMFDVVERVRALRTEVSQMEQQVEQLSQAGVLSADALIERGETVGDVCVVVCETPGANVNLMRQLIDQIRKKTNNAAVLLATTQGSDKVTFVAGISRTAVDKGGHAGNWVKKAAAVVGGGGGGRPDMAQAGGRSPEKLAEALDVARQEIRAMLGA